MFCRPPDLIICTCFIATIGIIYLVIQHLQLAFFSDNGAQESSPTVPTFQDSWIFRLVQNLLGYSIVVAPGALTFMYVRKTQYLERAYTGCFPKLIRLCFHGPDTVIGTEGGQTVLPPAQLLSPLPKTILSEAFLILFCFLGLQFSYLTWGVLQEKIMTQVYEDTNGVKTHFKDSQFLVFVNRILALILSGLYLFFRKQPRHTAPLYKYMHCSFSNIMSSWCQYEALKFVSFPTQVLAKASKIIPVMIMGKVISKTKYEYYEYVTAVLLSCGMTLFMFGSSEDHKTSTVTTISGLVLLAFYLIFDSFTSNWQGALFSQYKMTSIQMMCCVNLFSCLFTSVSLLPQGGFVSSLGFMKQFPKFAFDCLVLSVCSAIGQLFVYFTISKFGAVVFTIMMTIRQGLAILLSCIIYHHHISAVGVIGIILVFFSIFLRVYCNQRLRAIRRKVQNPVTEKI